MPIITQVFSATNSQKSIVGYIIPDLSLKSSEDRFHNFAKIVMWQGAQKQVSKQHHIRRRYIWHRGWVSFWRVREIWDFLASTKNHQTVPDEANCPLTWRRKNLYRLIHTFLKASFWTKLFRLSSWPWCLAAAVDYYIFRDRSIIPCYCNDNVNFLI